jgi:hypothetical protein
VQLFASVPLGYHTKKETGRTTSVRGLGDVVLMANLVLVNTGENTEADWKHAFQVGGGVKLPTGAFQEQEEGALINPKLQLGTGAVDFPLNLIYTLRYQRAGINTELNYRVNTTNRLGYRFGNRSNASARLFHAHGTSLTFSEQGTNNVNSDMEVELEVVAILDHAGNKTVKKVTIHCHS